MLKTVKGRFPESDAVARMCRRYHPGCIACGTDGLALRFSHQVDGSVVGEFDCPASCQGYSDRLHGGIVGVLLDAGMTQCLFAHGIAAFTVKLEMTFRHPVRIGLRAVVRAWIESDSASLYALRADVRQEDKICATARGLFAPRPERNDWRRPPNEEDIAMLDLKQTVDREWLQGRFLVLELAAMLDRLDDLAGREQRACPEDRRIAVLRRALAELPLTEPGRGRCERILHLYSELAETPG